MNKRKYEKFLILRHDIDKHPYRALIMAQREYSLGVKASYYFRSKPCSYDEKIISKIADLDHEIGYHYEELSSSHGNEVEALKLFETNLIRIRKLYPVKTICMHGSPLSVWDNKAMWKKKGFHEYGIVGGPSFSIDFNEIFYLTDTGRGWNNKSTSVRDCIDSPYRLDIKNGHHLMELIDNGKLPKKIMLNVHSQRWTNNFIFWLIELVTQNLKNVIKKLIKTYRT